MITDIYRQNMILAFRIVDFWKKKIHFKMRKFEVLFQYSQYASCLKNKKKLKRFFVFPGSYKQRRKASE